MKKYFLFLISTSIFLTTSSFHVHEEAHHELIMWMGQEMNNDHMLSILGDDYIYNKMLNYYTSKKEDITVYLEKKEGSLGILIKLTIEEDYFKRKNYKKNPLLGIVRGMEISECERVLKGNPKVEGTDSGHDLYGLDLGFRYIGVSPFENRTGIMGYMRFKKDKKRRDVVRLITLKRDIY